MSGCGLQAKIDTVSITSFFNWGLVYLAMKSLLTKVWKKVQREGQHSIFTAVYHHMNHYFLAYTVGDVITIRGITLDLRSTNVSQKMKLEMARGVYEAEEADAIHRYVSPDMDVIELGGCVGFTACYTNQMLDKSSTHVVVEPNDELIPIIRKNMGLNDCDFEIFHAAYSANEDSVTLGIPENVWGTSSARDGQQKITVGSINIDQLTQQLNIKRFVLIVDIEGAEADLISNELKILESCCEILIVEFHDMKEVYGHISSDILSAREKLNNSSFKLVEQSDNGVETYINKNLTDDIEV